MYLSGQDLKSLDEAIRSAYKPDDLRRLLKYQLNRDLDDITLAQSYMDITFDLLNTANREGWIEQLIVELRSQRENNTDFCLVLDDLIASKAVIRHLNGERLVQLATAFSEVVSVAALQEILKAMGRYPEVISGPLRDYLIKTLVTAVQERWAEDFFQALDQHGLSAPADGLIKALLVGDVSGFDKIAGDEGLRGEEIWRSYVTRAEILTRTSEFRRVIEQRAIAKVLDGLNSRLERLEQQICLVKLFTSGDAPYFFATGFLVATNMVLTTGSFLQSLQPLDPGKCIFDYRALSDGTEAGDSYHVPMAKDWLVASSPPERFGYVLLRLTESVGETRGWLDNGNESVPAAGDPLVIYQYLAGKPLRMSIGRVVECAGETLTYDALTAPGASGAPCLNAELDVVAIHKAKKIDFELRKEGTRMPAILADIKLQGVNLFINNRGK